MSVIGLFYITACHPHPRVVMIIHVGILGVKLWASVVIIFSDSDDDVFRVIGVGIT